MIKVVTEKDRPTSYSMLCGGGYLTYKCGMRDTDAWIDCPTCDMSIGAKASDHEISDEEFIEIVRKNGWAFIPNKHIACPECRKNKKKNNQN